MEEFIFEKKNSLPDSMCDEIIEYFNNKIPNDESNDCCSKDINADCRFHYNIYNCSYVTLELNSTLHHFLNNELLKCLEEYKTKLVFDFNKIIDKLVINEYRVLKYDKNNGYSTRHYNYINGDSKYYKLYNFLWFLNDCDIGGEIEFFGYYKIIPEKGKFIIFPTEWFFLFCDKIPKSCDKYIVKGWIYVYNN